MGTRQRKALEVSIASEGNQGVSPKNHPAPFIPTAIERVPTSGCQCCAIQDVLGPCRASSDESLDSQIYQRVNQTPSTNEFPRPIHKQHPKSYNYQRRRVLFHSHEGVTHLYIVSFQEYRVTSLCTGTSPSISVGAIGGIKRL